MPHVLKEECGNECLKYHPNCSLAWVKRVLAIHCPREKNDEGIRIKAGAPHVSRKWGGK